MCASKMHAINTATLHVQPRRMICTKGTLLNGQPEDGCKTLLQDPVAEWKT